MSPNLQLFYRSDDWSVFIDKNISEMGVGKRVLWVDNINLVQEWVTGEDLMNAFSKSRNRVLLILEGWEMLDMKLIPLSISMRFKNWFKKMSAKRRGRNHQPLPSLDNPDFRPTMGYNPEKRKITFGAVPTTSFYQRIFDR